MKYYYFRVIIVVENLFIILVGCKNWVVLGVYYSDGFLVVWYDFIDFNDKMR